jgi:hypothetical protein
MSNGEQQGLVNKGIAQINPLAFSGEATVGVLGLTRSGTSMLSSLLHAFGVFMGDRIDNAVFEDVEVAAFIDKGDFDGLRDFAARRNAAHEVWGFKRPNAYKVLPQLTPVLRNPRLIVTFRDILAIAMRNHVSMQMDVLPALPRYVAEYGELVRNISAVNCPMLLVSYEKFLQFPEESVQAVADFCGITLTPQLRDAAMGVVRNGPDTYIQASRLRYVGNVDRVVQGKLRGWAMVVDQPKIKAKVRLMADGKEIATVVANRPRTDLVNANIGDGHHGFEIDLGTAVRPETLLEVKFGNTEAALNNSGKEAAAYGLLF